MRPDDPQTETSAFKFFEPEPGSDSFIQFWSFSAGDIKDLGSFAARLREPSDELSKFLRDNLSPETVSLLSKYKKGEGKRLRQALVDDLNRIIRCHFHEHRRMTGNRPMPSEIPDLKEFLGYKWPDKAIISLGEEKLCSGRLEELGLDEMSFRIGGNQDEVYKAKKLRVIRLLDWLTDRFPAIQLNRMLLHHAYPDEISRRPQQPLIYLNVDAALRDAAICASARFSAWPYWDTKFPLGRDILRIGFNDKTEAVKSAKSLTTLRSEMALARGICWFDAEFDIEPEENPQQLDAWLSHKMPHIPPDTLRDWIVSGRISVKWTDDEGYPHSNCVPVARQICVAPPRNETTNAYEEVTVKQDETIECTLEEFAALYKDFATKLLAQVEVTKPRGFIKLDQRLLKLAEEWIRVFGGARSVRLIPELVGNSDSSDSEAANEALRLFNRTNYYGTHISRKRVDENGLLVVVIPTHKEMFAFLRKFVANCSSHKPRPDQPGSAEQSSKTNLQPQKTYLVTIGKDPDDIKIWVIEDGRKKPFECSPSRSPRRALWALALLGVKDVDTEKFAYCYSPHLKIEGRESTNFDNVFHQPMNALKKLLKGVDYKGLGMAHHRRIVGLNIENQALESELKERLQMNDTVTR